MRFNQFVSHIKVCVYTGQVFNKWILF